MKMAKIKAYKGFDKELKCRGFQFEIGKEYEEDSAELCKKGFRACEYPLDCFSYYRPSDSRFCEVDLDATDETENDSKRVGKKIKIGAEIGIKGLVEAAVKFVFEKAGEKANSATGDGSANVSTGLLSSNEGNGEANVCVAWGPKSKCRGKKGCTLVLSEWDEWDGNKYPFLGSSLVVVDGKKFKEDVWYERKNGKVVEA